jgi:hypothetical protein
MMAHNGMMGGWMMRGHMPYPQPLFAPPSLGTLIVWYVGGLLAFAVMAGIAGAVIAAVHNAVVRRA